MTSPRRRSIAGAAMLFGLYLFFLRPGPRRPVQPTPSPAPPPRSAAAMALRRAAACRTRAKLAASEARSKLETWDPRAAAEMDAETWRLQQLAADRDGNLREARQWVKQAARLARTREDAYQAAELLVLLDHESGHHDAELRAARGLIALAPRTPRARLVLQRAEQCCRMRGAGASAWDKSAAP